jgi:hypothetical protein
MGEVSTIGLDIAKSRLHPRSGERTAAHFYLAVESGLGLARAE